MKTVCCYWKLLYSGLINSTSLLFSLIKIILTYNMNSKKNYQKRLILTQPANSGSQNVPRTSPSNVPRTSPKDPILPSRGRPDLTSWGRPEMTSRGRPNLTFKGRPWEVDSGRPQDVIRTSPRRPSRSHFAVPKFLLTFLSELSRLTKSI